MKIKLLTVLTLATASCFAQSQSTKERLDAATTAINEIMAADDNAIPQELFDNAQCAVIVPGLKKGAFFIGGKYGRGFVVCRNASGAGWGAPGAVKVEGGSVGFQIGGSETDVVMLIMNKAGADRLLSTTKFTLGGEAEAAAGPVGRYSAAQTDASMRAKILTWSRSRGVFAGISLAGSTLRPDGEALEDLYGTKITNNDKVARGGKPVPVAAKELVAAMNKYSHRKDKK